MNKKGFTLIELLAVIVILALIAVITAPIIFGVIDDSRMNSFTRSIEEMMNVIDMDYNEYARSGEVEYKYENNKLICVKCNKGEDLELDFTGNVEGAKGTFINNNGTITISNFENDRYEAKIENGKVVTEKK